MKAEITKLPNLLTNGYIKTTGADGTIIVDDVEIPAILAEQTTQNDAIALNTAKVTNATHTGDVTGATALTVQPTAISGKGANAGLVGTEEVLINKAGTLEKTTTQAIADLGGGGGATLKQQITQNAHGFIVGDAIKLDGTTWIKSLADLPANAGTLGVVSEVIDVNTFVYQYGGILTVGTWTTGVDYFLSPNTAGVIIPEPSYNIGEVREYIGTGTDQGLLINVDLGDEITNPTTFDLNSLTDVTITSPINGQALIYNGASWVNTNLAGGGDALTTNPLSQFAATTSEQLAGVISDETGTGALVFATSPTLVTPNIGVATGTSFNSITGLASVAPLANGTAAVGISTLAARQDHVHPLQTTISGNAGSATILQTTRNIAITGDASWNVNFNGSADVTAALTLSTTGVGAGTYRSITVDTKGRVTAGTNPTTLSGYSITDTIANFNAAVSDGNFVSKQSKSLTIESPTATEDISMFFTEVAITITKLIAVVRGTTPSVTWTIRHSTDRSAVGNQVVTGGTATTSVTTGSVVTTFNDATIPANSFVWLETTAQTGTVNELNLTAIYTED